ncbi:hypothetical protein NL676_028990 [Syzygium grande]|nr:hypothetical protein NL676_028990 [Syzygium grande]
MSLPLLRNGAPVAPPPRDGQRTEAQKPMAERDTVSPSHSRTKRRDATLPATNGIRWPTMSLYLQDCGGPGDADSGSSFARGWMAWRALVWDSCVKCVLLLLLRVIPCEPL